MPSGWSAAAAYRTVIHSRNGGLALAAASSAPMKSAMLRVLHMLLYKSGYRWIYPVV
jgi:hypothetical protein